jgi:poly-gamma-glutamate synthesis protein (capsule biosynthesis protein)
VNGQIPRPVDFAWPWGDALCMLDDLAPDVRVINLETSITRSNEFAARKAVHYRMSPDNVPCLAALRPDVCALANNHVLDFGSRGVEDTLEVLSRAGLRVAGAGHDVQGAREPAIVPAGLGVRLVVFACAMASSGVPSSWAATTEQAGICFVPDLSDAAAVEITERVHAATQPGDIVAVSIHWGSNWGYDVPADQRRFAHRLIDGGVDIVHGHSSHHPRPIEIYHDRLVLYGCGDFINDYEGIRGYDEYRDDLRLMYIASVDRDTGALVTLQMPPMQARKMRLHHASRADTEWLHAVLDRVSLRHATHVDLRPDGMLVLRRA